MSETAPGIFYRIPASIAADTRIGWLAKGLLCLLAFRQGINGQSWPSVTRLALDLGTCKRSIQRAKSELVKTGYISIIEQSRGGVGRSNIYRLNGDNLTGFAVVNGDNLTGLNHDNLTQKKEKIQNEHTNSLPSKKFTPPTALDVTGYAKSIDFSLDGAAFVDYYTARGWTFGPGRPMRDWRAAVRNWKARQKTYGKTTTDATPHRRRAKNFDLPYEGDTPDALAKMLK